MKRQVPNALNLFCLFFEWALILFSAGIGIHFDWPVKILMIFLIGSRQHALGTLLHEASHFRLLSNKKWNDFIGQIFLATPALIDLRQYRSQHLSHHSHNQTEKDQQYWRKKNDRIFEFPKSRKQIILLSLAFLSGFGLLQVLRDLFRTWKKKSSAGNRILKWSFALSLFFLLWNCDLLAAFGLYWMLPVLTVFPLLNFWRTVAEHLAIPDPLKKTRSLRLNPILAWLLTPYYINYHGEHHADPSLSWQDLPRASLIQSDVWVTKGLLSLFRECAALRNS